MLYLDKGGNKLKFWIKGIIQFDYKNAVQYLMSNVLYVLLPMAFKFLHIGTI